MPSDLKLSEKSLSVGRKRNKQTQIILKYFSSKLIAHCMSIAINVGITSPL